jgi:N-acetylglutamate synthase-like GNAT family acetyltransferase
MSRTSQMPRIRRWRGGGQSRVSGAGSLIRDASESMTTPIQYSVRGEVSPTELGPLLRKTGMGDYSDEKLQAIIAGSTTYVTARHVGNLVGFGRMFTDRATLAYINNMAVHPEYQRQGIGTKILDLLVHEAGDVNSVYLYTKTADSLYLRFGFETSDKRLYIFRRAEDE